MTLAVVLSAGLASGVGGVAVALAYAVYLRPLPLPEAHRVVMIADTAPLLPGGWGPISHPEYLALRDAGIFEEVAATAETEVFMEFSPGRSRSVRVGFVSGSQARLLGVRMGHGRAIGPHDDRPGPDPVCVLGSGLSRARFGSIEPPGEARIRVGEIECQVIGVLGETGPFGELGELWLPMSSARRAGLGSMLDDPAYSAITVWGRLRGGLTSPATLAQVSAVLRGAAVTDPRIGPRRPVLLPLRRWMYPPEVRRPVWGCLLAAAAVVLLVTLNTTDLFAVALLRRTQEFAIRAVVGATAGDLRTLVLRGGLAHGAAAGVLGSAVAVVVIHLIQGLMPSGPAGLGLSSSAATVAAAAGIAVGVGGMASTAAWLLLRRRFVSPQLHQLAASAGTGGATAAARGIWVASASAQLAAAGALGAVLASLAVGVSALRGGVGFQPQGLFAARATLPDTYTPQHVLTFAERARSALSKLPGVQFASYGRPLPLDRVVPAGGFSIENQPRFLRSQGDTTPVRCLAGPGFLRTLGVRWIEGSDRLPSQGSDAAVVDETAARQFWPAKSPVGARTTFDLTNPGAPVRWTTVEAVIEDMTPDLVSGAKWPHVCVPFSASPSRRFAFVLRTQPGAPSLGLSVLRTLREHEPELLVEGPFEMTEIIDDRTAALRLAARTAAVVTGVAGVLQLIATIGLAAHTAASRRREMAIRAALGATRLDLLAAVGRDSLLAAVLGVAAGGVAAWAATRIAFSLVEGAYDLSLAHIGALACVFPLASIGAVALLAVRDLPIDVAARLREL